MTDFVVDSFEIFPPDATVFVNWSYFTPLLYSQTVHHIRPDVTLVEIRRYYESGEIIPWTRKLDDFLGPAPTIIDESGATYLSRLGSYEIEPIGQGWYEVTSMSASP